MQKWPTYNKITTEHHPTTGQLIIKSGQFGGTTNGNNGRNIGGTINGNKGIRQFTYY
ncbi:MAG TPA: hypothetical protein VGC17_00155 [Lactovum miscens]|uniref:hypothetical protein n=1 Tax=Lactovum miscens TaxID=190387 RepID=UPI002EDB6F04